MTVDGVAVGAKGAGDGIESQPADLDDAPVDYFQRGPPSNKRSSTSARPLPGITTRAATPAPSTWPAGWTGRNSTVATFAPDGCNPDDPTALCNSQRALLECEVA